ncbi:hypothetical protein GCM10010230_21840 [Streptomyces narbonensis]|nr:hypothetical protein GCM10010230_21840 [Streptomyces narbonensis]
MPPQVLGEGLAPPGTHHVEPEPGPHQMLSDEPGTGVLLVLYDENSGSDGADRSPLGSLRLTHPLRLPICFVCLIASSA